MTHKVYHFLAIIIWFYVNTNFILLINGNIGVFTYTPKKNKIFIK